MACDGLAPFSQVSVLMKEPTIFHAHARVALQDMGLAEDPALGSIHQLMADRLLLQCCSEV